MPSGDISIYMSIVYECFASEALTAQFLKVRAEHDGQTPFTFEVEFSDDVTAGYQVLRDEAFTITGGTITQARRVGGRDDLREIHVQPSGSDEISISLPVTSSCDDVGAICTSDGRQLSNTQSATIAGPPTTPLTASFDGTPDEHDGQDTFVFKVQFSEDVATGYQVLRDEAFSVSGGTVRKARRVDGRDDLREIHVAPSSHDPVTITLPATTSCEGMSRTLLNLS